MNVTKRDGILEELDVRKISKVINWACEGLNVSASQIEMKSRIQFYDGIRTADIHRMLIKSSADLIEADTPDYQYAAARLLMFDIRKQAYGQFTPPSLTEHLDNMIARGLYDAEIRNMYTDEEFAEIESFVDHDRDFNIAYAGAKQLEGKYLIQDRVTGQVYESPQMAYIFIALALFNQYKENRMAYIKKFYDAVSTFKVSLPTPIMGGLRSKTKQFASCFVVESGDSLDSINATSSAIVKYVSQRAGIGLNVGNIRAVGSPIRGGEVRHTGLIPFLKLFEAAVKSCCLTPDTYVEVLEDE